MISLHRLSSTTKIGKRRLGQGHGSGRGKTAGRGTKGQKARGNIPLSFEGGAVALIKRLPFRRGKGRNKVFKNKPVVVPLAALNIFRKQQTVDTQSLIAAHIVDEKDAKTYGVKVLSNGTLNVPVIVKVPVSKSAAKKIEKIGGRVET
ncbi:MAG: 50S ribosomal protein L15 [Candidatus Levybacteria bacterium]|nr:50S ribosomal protein L15 [Candidatus Levybacteria bacterium]